LKYQIKPISNRTGYWIDTNGKVWSAKKKVRPDKGWIITDKPRKKIKTHVCRGGYLGANLLADGRRKNTPVHQLVLETFIGKRPEGMECCHNNGNKLDNRLSNLRWDTRKSNVKDAIKHGTFNMSGLDRKGENHAQAKLNEFQIRVIRKYPRYRGYQIDLAEIFNINQGTVSNIICRKIWRSI